MVRYGAIVAYDGTAYKGFQRQPAPTATIQSALEAAIESVSGQLTGVVAAGRTDSGVHAAGQVVAFDLGWKHSVSDLLRAINAQLPLDIGLQDLWRQDGFHPRYDALWRQYVYRIATPKVRNPLLNRQVWQLVGQSLDLERIREAAAICLGEYDFAAFGTAPQEGSSNTVRRVFRSQWEMEEGEFGAIYTYRIRGTAFLYHMVRRLVGTMAQVGTEKISIEDFTEILLSRDIERAKLLAPPQGLVLEAVGYPQRKTIETELCEPSAITAEAPLEGKT